MQLALRRAATRPAKRILDDVITVGVVDHPGADTGQTDVRRCLSQAQIVCPDLVQGECKPGCIVVLPALNQAAQAVAVQVKSRCLA